MEYIVLALMFAWPVALFVQYICRKVKQNKTVDNEADLIFVHFGGEKIPMTLEQKVMLWDEMGRDARKTYLQAYIKLKKQGKNPDGTKRN